jgi:RecA-family ATPase
MWMLAGKEKGGKTWTALSLAVHMALGRDWLGCANTLGRPARVLVIALEDNARRLRGRLWRVCRGIGVTPDDPVLRANLRIFDTPLRIPGNDVEAFAEEMQRWRPDVIILDSLTRVMVGDQNRIADAAVFTHEWRELVRRTGASIGFLHHTNKEGLGERIDPFVGIRGSSELMAAPRNVLVMRRVADGASELRIRGNLDLTRNGFVLGYEQRRENNRLAVVLRDDGPITTRANKPTGKREARRRDGEAMRAKRETAARKLLSRGKVTAESLCEAHPELFGSPQTAGRTLTSVRKQSSSK